MKRNLNLSVEEAREIYKNASPKVKALIETTFSKDELNELNILTLSNDNSDMDININNRWAGRLFMAEKEGVGYKGNTISGHKASMYLSNLLGQWFDKDGNIIEGYFYYKVT